VADHQIIDLAEARDYLEWLDAEELADLERQAASGFAERDDTWEKLSKALHHSHVARAFYVLRCLEAGSLSRRDELEFAREMAELRRDHPMPVDPAWSAFLSDHPELEGDL
jgi:hypothetical protein